MQVMVLAAGFGERLKPLTERLPKPALPLFDDTVLGRLVKDLAAQGADRIVYNTHHLADEVARVAEGACPEGVELLRSDEDPIQGTGGALREASDLFRDEPLVVLNGDVIHDVDLHRLVAFHRARGAVATLVCRADPQTEAYGPLGVDADGRVRRFLGWKAQGVELSRLKTVMFTGIQVVEPETFGLIPSGVVSTTETLYPALLKQDEPVFGVVHDGYWMDIGTPARYLKAHRDMLRGKMGAPPESRWRPAVPAAITIKEPFWVAEDSTIEMRSIVGPYAVIEPGCRLGSGVVVERSLLMEGAEVGPRTFLEGCIVAPGVELEAEESFSNQLIALDEDGDLQLTPIGPGGEAA